MVVLAPLSVAPVPPLTIPQDGASLVPTALPFNVVEFIHSSSGEVCVIFAVVTAVLVTVTFAELEHEPLVIV